MPYSKLSESRIKQLHGVPLTLAQVNWLAKLADKIGGEFGWPTAIKQFQNTHHISNGHWVASEKKELSQEVIVTKETDGRYLIKSISTVALPDQEDETFTTQAMDEETRYHKEFGAYPEYDLFHNPLLSIGRVEKMGRVGIFAIDEGHSYTDPFSLGVCENMLVNNTDGKWRNSRAFYALEVQGECPECGSKLGITAKHMMVGYKCPQCQVALAGFKGVLKHVHFTKTRTIGITVTDHPCVLYTGVQAFRPDSTSFMEETMAMNKEQLKQKLLAAHVPEAAVDDRLSKITEEQLKELKLDDIPDAVLLKEFELEPETEGEQPDTTATEKDANQGDESSFVLDKSAMDAIATTVKETVTTVVKELLGNLELEVPEFKELSDLTALKADVAEIKKMLTTSDAQKVQQVMKDAPRTAKLRIIHYDPNAKTTLPVEKQEGQEDAPKDGVVIEGADGEHANTMTEFMMDKRK